jgi:AAA+ superfamily predicted ATPase
MTTPSPRRTPTGSLSTPAIVHPEPARRRPNRHHQIELLRTFIRACYPIISVVSWEERRFLEGLQSLLGPARPLYHWTFTRGMVAVTGDRRVEPTTVGDPIAALKFAMRSESGTVVVFSDLHPWLEGPSTPEQTAVIRLLRDWYLDARRLLDTERTFILLAPVLCVPRELEKEMVVVDYPLPDRTTLESILQDVIARQAARTTPVPPILPEVRDRLVDAARGLTWDEAQNAFMAALLDNGQIDGRDVQLVVAEKQLIIRKSGLLDYIPPGTTLKDVGGLENLKRWLERRSRIFTREAREFGIPQPKGVLLTGVQGCGKSLSARAIAEHWALPLLRLDVGKVFGGLVGSSEENIRKAIRLAEAMAPCVLWLDEIEKGFAGTGSSGQTDGGTTARVFATFLTWLQEKTSRVFVVATANRIEALPPELLRKGRFDEIFFIDLPGGIERGAIFDIHLRARKRAPEAFDLGVLVAASQGFSGAEIEQAVIESLVDAFDQGTDLAQDHLLTALRRTVPLSVTMKESIAELRDWGRSRAVSATG